MEIHKSRHLFLKFNKFYENTNIDTMIQHSAIDNIQGSVIWGAFTRSLTANNFEKRKIAVMDNQVRSQIPTFVFFYSREEEKIFVAEYIEWFSRYEIIQDSRDINLIPNYYHDRVGVAPDPFQEKLTCKAYLRISNIREIDEEYSYEMVNFENHDSVIGRRLDLKQQFNVSYINISSNLYKKISQEYSSYVSDGIEILEEEAEAYFVRNNKEDLGKLIDAPKRTNPNKEKILKNRKAKKIDYIKLAKSNEIIGSAGEKFVLRLLKKELKKAGQADLAKKVRHVSKKDGDGLGYDILSYDLEGNEIYIEVKSTTKGASNHFYMTSFERDFAIKNSSNYKLYRVFNLDVELEMGDYYIIEKDIEKQLNFITDTYRVFR